MAYNPKFPHNSKNLLDAIGIFGEDRQRLAEDVSAILNGTKSINLAMETLKEYADDLIVRIDAELKGNAGKIVPLSKIVEIYYEVTNDLPMALVLALEYHKFMTGSYPKGIGFIGVNLN